MISKEVRAEIDRFMTLVGHVPSAPGNIGMAYQYPGAPFVRPEEGLIPHGEDMVDSLMAYLEQHDGASIYYSVLPMTVTTEIDDEGREKKHWNSDKDVAVTSTSALWLDFDGKDFNGDDWEAGKAQARQVIEAMPVKPSILRDSGNGYHAYFLLSEPIPLAEAKAIMMAMVAATGADPACTNPSRVMRMPGSTNCKDPKDPKPTITLWMDEVKYDVEQIRQAYPATLTPQAGVAGPVVFGPPVPAPDMEELPASVQKALLEPAEPGERSNKDFGVIKEMLTAGFNPDQIRALWVANPDTIGNRYAVPKDGDRYLKITIESAMTAVAKQDAKISEGLEADPRTDEGSRKVVAALAGIRDEVRRMAEIGRLAQKYRIPKKTLVQKVREHITATAKTGQQQQHTNTTVGHAWPQAPATHHNIVLPGDPFGQGPEGVTLVRMTERGPEVETIFSQPTYVSKTFEDVQDRTRQAEVTFREPNGTWGTILTGPEDFADHRATAKLMKMGLPIAGNTKAAAAYLLRSYDQGRNRYGLPHQRSVRTIGRIPTESIAVLPGASWGPEGPGSTNSDIVYADQSQPAHVTGYQPLPEGTKQEAEEVISTLLRCAAPNIAYPINGWMAAAIWAPEIREATRQFPQLHVYGTKESGKTSLLMIAAQTIHGGPGEAGSAKRPPFSMLREMASSTSCPIILDEYRTSDIKPDHLSNLHHFLRQNYTGSVESRGRADLSTIAYRLIAPVVLAGESRMHDPANLDRMVMVPVAAATVHAYPGAMEAYNSLIADPDKLRRVAGYLLQVSLQKDEYMAIPALRQRLLERQVKWQQMAQAAGGKIGPRTAHGLACMVEGLEWLQRVVGLEIAIPEQAILEMVMASHTEDDTLTGAFIRFMEYYMANKDRALGDIPMDVRSGELRIAKEAAFRAFLKHQKDQNRLHLGDDALERDLKAHTDVCKGVGVSARIHAKKVRSIVLDIGEIEKQYGVSGETWDAAANAPEEGLPKVPAGSQSRTK